MRIFRSIYAASLAVLILTSCGTSQTVTRTSTPAPPEVPETPTTPSTVQTAGQIVAKKGEMSLEEIQAWPHMDIHKDSVPGMSLKKAYEFLDGKSGKTVIVGVIDSGIDIEHEDLKDVVWINDDEIAGNNKDDDLSLIHI